MLEETPMSISITISDNGEGIEKSDIKNIFKRFYKGFPGKASVLTN